MGDEIEIDGRSFKQLHDKTLAGWLAEQQCPGAFEEGDLWTWLAHYSKALNWLDEALHARRSELEAFGIHHEDFVRMVVEARIAEPEADMENTGGGSIMSDAARVCVRRLHRAGLDAELIADLINVPVGHVRTYVNRHHLSKASQEILALHAAGRTPVQIAEELGAARSWVYQILEEHGYTPNRTRAEPTSDADRRKVVRLFREGLRGSELVRATGLEKHRVYKVLQAEQKKGNLPEYGAAS